MVYRKTCIAIRRWNMGYNFSRRKKFRQFSSQTTLFSAWDKISKQIVEPEGLPNVRRRTDISRDCQSAVEKLWIHVTLTP